MKKIFLAAILAVSFLNAAAQNDSAAFFSGNWSAKQVAEGIELKQCSFDGNLFSSSQYISVLEVKDRKLDVVEAADRTLETTSSLAKANGAVAAINAGFFIMKAPYGSSMYLRIDNDTKFPNQVEKNKGLHRSERQNGAVVITGGKLYIVKADSIWDWERLIAGEDVLTSGPLMIVGGENVPIKGEPFNTNRHPRTAIGKKADGTVVMVVADGRFSKRAEGLSIEELQQVMGWLGCVSALNLDGGGSSAMVIGKDVVNHPSDNRLFDHHGERKVHNAIIVH